MVRVKDLQDQLGIEGPRPYITVEELAHAISLYVGTRDHTRPHQQIEDEWLPIARRMLAADALYGAAGWAFGCNQHKPLSRAVYRSLGAALALADGVGCIACGMTTCICIPLGDEQEAQ